MAPPESSTAGSRRLIRCHDCDLVHHFEPIPEGTRSRCTRCGAVLFTNRRRGMERALALNLTSLFLWAIANSFPFMTLEIEGRRQPTILMSAAEKLYDDGLWELATLVLLFVIAFPAIKVLASLAVIIPLQRGARPRYLAPVFRLIDELHPWSMTEVFLVGVLVAYVKLIDMATIGIGPALFAFVGLIITMMAADNILDPTDIWERIQPAPALAPGATVEYAKLVSCHTCALVVELPDGHHANCPRCGASLHRRKPNSLSRTAALLAAAAILYLPANIYPVMTVVSFGRGSPDTILSGVEELLHAGMWPLALLVFFASITVPVLKMIGLLVLLVTVRRGSTEHLRQRTELYRIVETVGRWSMIDIFMLSILVALVRLGAIATIVPGPGAISFAGVVVITMFSAMNFDPRLIWDAAGKNNDE